MKRHCLGPVLIPVFLVLAAAPVVAYGPNLLSNPGFDTSTVGWSLTGPGTLSWSPTDALGNPHSGSAKILVSGPLPVVLTTSPCVTLSPGDRYVITGSVWVEQADAADSVGLGIQFFTDAACATPSAGGFSELDLTVPQWLDAAGGVQVEGPGGDQSMKIMLRARDNGPSSNLTVYFDNPSLRTGACAPLGQALCLNNGRFEVFAHWKLADGTEGEGRAVPFANDSGSFWFFSPTNIEMDVKVLNGCGINNRYWVFAAGLTNVEVTLYVRDTETGQLKTYTNPQGQTFLTITDTSAFATCP